MKGINKQQASEAFGFGYRVEYESEIYWITMVGEDQVILYSLKNREVINFNKFGSTAFILCRPFTDLTREIDGSVPIVELAKIAAPLESWSLGSSGKVAKSDFSSFGFDSSFWKIDGRISDHVSNQHDLFNKLKSLHFNISFDDEVVRWIEKV